MANYCFAKGVAVLGYVLLSISSLSTADEVTVVADRWYPYNGTPKSPEPGYLIELVRDSLAKGGHTVQYQLMSWDRALTQVREGNKHCVVGAIRGEAEDFVFPQSHQGVVQNGFYRRAGDSWLYQGPESLEGIRVGTIAGYKYDELIDNHVQQVEPARGKFAVEENLKALINGDLDVVLGSNVVIGASIQKQGWKNRVEFAGDLDGPNKIYVACSPQIANSAEYVKLVDAGLKEWRSSGVLTNVLKKYSLKDWQPVFANE